MIHNDDTRRFVVLRSPIVNACPLSPRPRQIARATHFRNGRVRLCLGERYAGRRVHLRVHGLIPGDEQGCGFRCKGVDWQSMRRRLDETGGTTYEQPRYHWLRVTLSDVREDIRVLHPNASDTILFDDEVCSCDACYEAITPLPPPPPPAAFAVCLPSARNMPIPAPQPAPKKRKPNPSAAERSVRTRVEENRSVD